MPWVASGSVSVVIAGGGVMKMLRALVALRPVAVSLNFTVKFTVPPALGVPEMTPVAGARVRPAGSWPTLTDQVPSPPALVNVVEYGTPLSPWGREVVVMVGGSDGVTVTVVGADWVPAFRPV